jgi:hypothetical protein
VGFDITDQVPFKFFAFFRHRTQWEYNKTVHQKAYDSVRREVLYSILIEFGIPMKLVT